MLAGGLTLENVEAKVRAKDGVIRVAPKGLQPLLDFEELLPHLGCEATELGDLDLDVELTVTNTTAMSDTNSMPAKPMTPKARLSIMSGILEMAALMIAGQPFIIFLPKQDHTMSF